MRNRRNAQSRKDSAPKPRRRGFGKRLLRWLGFAALAWILLTALPVLAMRWLHPLGSSFMLQTRLEAMWEGDFRYRTQYDWVDLNHISPNAALAVIASEDQQFPFHFGFDLKSIREAAQHNEHSKRVRGASTITQQVAKNLFLWSGRSYLRKGMETWFAMLIELSWPKQRILEVYLNIAEMGHGVYGVEAASHKFYRHSAARLNRYEAATLAAVLPNPRRLHADNPSRYVASRRDWIVGQMRMLGGNGYLMQLKPQS